MIEDLRFIPFEPHRQIVAELVEEARGDAEIIGALLIGSLGRGNAIPGSDIDLLLLRPDGRGKERLLRNHERHGVLIEFHHRNVASARAQMDEEPMWLYAYLDSRILYDPTGELTALVAFAGERYAAFRATDAMKKRSAFIVDRTREKLQAAVDAGDAIRAGGVASAYAQAIINGLWTAFDKPPLGVTEMWVRLPNLIGLPSGVAEQLRALFLGGRWSGRKWALLSARSLSPNSAGQLSNRRGEAADGGV